MSQATEETRPAPRPAYFLSLELENVRCFGPRQRLDLSRPDGRPARWTILLGDNGVGKTTVLQCLAGLQAMKLTWGATSPAMGKVDARFSSLLRSPHIEGRISAEVALLPRLDSLGKEDFLTYIYGDGSYYVESSDNGGELAGLICHAYGASRSLHNAALATELEADTIANIFESNLLLNPTEWLLKLDYSAKSGGALAAKSQSYLSRVTETLVEILPDVLAIRLRPPERPGEIPTVLFRTHYGEVSLQGLSLGYKSLIAWMVDFAARMFERYPESPNPIAEPAIVLVDEIDLHLHPRWQRNIMRYLSERFPNTQFIVTAHSPLIVQAATDANVAVLRREGDHVVIDNNPASVHGWRVDQVLASDLFGIENPRSPDLDEPLRRWRELLGKGVLTDSEKDELRSLDERLSNLPTGETPADIEAMDVIRKAAELLKKRGLSGDKDKPNH